MQTHLEAQQNLETLQSNMEETIITKELLEKEAILHQALHSACRLEEDYWRKNSKGKEKEGEKVSLSAKKYLL